MNADFVFLTEKEAMWAKMLMQVLQDNQIPVVSEPVNGAGFSIKTGIPDRIKVYIPAQAKPLAEELLHELFPEES